MASAMDVADLRNSTRCTTEPVSHVRIDGLAESE